MALRGVRSIEIEASSVSRATDFYCRVWGLDQVCTEQGSTYLRGSGSYHHILAIHKAAGAPALRRVTFDAADSGTVEVLYDAVKRSGRPCEKPHALAQPGGGYGFGFTDSEGRVFAIVADAEDRTDAAKVLPDKPRKITHVNFNAVDVAATNSFLTEVLGLRLIDQTPALYFFHAQSADHNCVVGARHLP